MQKLIIIICAIFFGIGVVMWDTTAPPSKPRISAQNKQNDKTVPNFAFTTIEGKKLTLSEFKGKTVLINVWATWCPPCIAEIPQLLKLAKRDKDQLVFIALSVDNSPRKIKSYLGKLPKGLQEIVASNNVMFVHDKNKAISEDILGIAYYPETLIIAPNGSLIKKITGVIDWLSDETKSLLYDKATNLSKE